MPELTSETGERSLHRGHGSQRRHSFGGDVLKVFFGAFSSQLFSILAAPVLTRLFSPESFGLMAVYTSLVGVGSVIASLRYDQAILLPEREEDAGAVLALSVVIALVVSTSIGVLILGCADSLQAVGAAKLGWNAWFVPAAILCGAISQSLMLWRSRARDFGAVSRSRAICSGITNACQLSFGFASWSSAGALIAGSFVGTCTSVAVLGLGIGKRLRHLLYSQTNSTRLRWAAYRYREFPLFNAWAVLLNTVSWQMPPVLLMRYFGSSSAGYFSVGMRVLAVPMDVVALSIAQVLFQRAAEAKSEGKLGEVVESAVSRLIIFSLFPIAVLGAIAPQLFSLVFGSRWSEAGVYVRLLVPWTCVWFISSPLSVLISVLEKQRFGLIINCAIFLTRIGSLYAGYLLHSVYVALAIFCGTGVVTYGWLAVRVIKDSGARLSGRQATEWLAIAAPLACLLGVVKALRAASITQVFAGALAIALFLGFQLMRDPATLKLICGRLHGEK